MADGPRSFLLNLAPLMALSRCAKEGNIGEEGREEKEEGVKAGEGE
jgi:hypothetical protein